MLEHKLPEELLREIFAHNFAIPHDVFCGFTTRMNLKPLSMRKPTSPERCHDVLLVSKRWLRVGSPLLYESVSLRTPTHTQTVAKVIKHNPNLGRAVRKLRLFGGYGRDLRTIIQASPNIHTVYLNMSVASSDSIVGIKMALPILNPTRLHLEEMGRRNKQSSELHELLNANVGKWASLRYIYYNPFANLGPMMEALKEAPALEELWADCRSIMHTTHFNPELREILAKPSMRRLHCLGHGHRELKQTLVNCRYPNAIQKLMTYDDEHKYPE